MNDTAHLAIAPDVLIGITNLALESIEGVRPVQPSQRVGEILSGRRSRGVAIERDASGVWIDVTLAVDYGIEIPKVAASVQRAVRESVASMTGLEVRSVNVYVEAVDLNERESSD
ncbi:MAG TPA: Asp23/Gls24 family envelope stress response protein [Trueperaceae bacterium]|nr:Asp23/Gls24 family envelope stress response protein [Trueperaceae bacterium]